MKFINFIVCLLILFNVLGCASMQGKDSLNITSYDGVSRDYPYAASELATKAAYTMAERYPTSTPLFLVKAKSGSFADSFESALRNQGFNLEAISPSTQGTINLGYTLDMITGDAKTSCYLQVKLSDGATFGQSYEINQNESAPVPTGTMTGTAPFYSVTPAISTAPGMGYGVTSEEWKITPGNLKPQLEEWTKKAGYQLIWKAEHDFNMQSHAIFRDSFLGAIKRVFTRMHLNGNALRASIYEENKVVEVLED